MKEYIEGAYIMLFKKLKERNMPDLEKIGMFVTFFRQLAGFSIDVKDFKLYKDEDLNIDIIEPKSWFNSRKIVKEYMDNLEPYYIYSLKLRSEVEVPDRFC